MGFGKTLKEIAIADLADDEPIEAGDLLQLTLKIKPKGQPSAIPIILQLNIVADPVLPAPEAAYALLRRQQFGSEGKVQVECVRFAWGPEASRIELVCPKDLQTEIVRRRAVFHWLDVARPATVQGYAIQKIAQSGATHIVDASGRVRDCA